MTGVMTTKRSMSFPILRVVGGLLLVLAGIVAYSGVMVGPSAVLVLVLGGAVVLVVAVFGYRPRPWDVAIFIVGILVLGGVSAGYSNGPQTVTYSATRAQVQSSAISVTVASGTGSVSVGFTDRTDLAYQISFTNSLWFTPQGGKGVDTVTNSTTNGIFNLNVGTTWSSVSVLVGRGYAIDVKITAGTGSVSLVARGTSALRNVSLYSSTGSVSAVLDSPAIENLVLRADTGSVSLASGHLGAAGSHVPITLSASTGSVSMRVSLESQDAVSLTANTGLGSISQSLSGFTISQNSRTSLAASAGDIGSAPKSFVITATANLGSVDLTAGFAPG